MNTIYARLAIIVVLVMVFGEFAPGPTNAVLALVLLGIILSRYQAFSAIAPYVAKLTGGK